MENFLVCLHGIMTTFTQTYQCKIDAKGRIAIPSSLKEDLAPFIEQGMVLKRSAFDPCVELYTKEKWNEIIQKISKLNQFSRKNRDFIRLFTADVTFVEPDSAGRLLVPKPLFDYAKLNKEIVLSSMMGFLEIWDKTQYENKIASIDEEEFARLTEETMNDNGTELS